MSRNVRQTQPATPVKALKRRGSDSSSSLDDLSDSDGYSALGAISDSEDDDEEDVDAAEEEHIVTHNWHDSNQSSPRPIEEKDEEGDDEEESDEDDEDDVDDDDDDDDEAVDDNASWNGIMSEGIGSSDHASPATQDVKKSVRFIGVPDSDGDTTETDDGLDDEFYPDIFVDQSALAPSFRREIELDDPGSSSDSASFWDLHGNPDPGHQVGDSPTVATMLAPREVEPFQGFPDFDFDTHTFDDDSTPIATPMPIPDPFMDIPIASPTLQEDDSSLDGYQSE
jgi:hypothetical protein